MRTRHLITAIAGATIVGFAGVAIGAALDDPKETVGVVTLSEASSTSPAGAPGRTTQVAGLEELSGVVTRDDNDLDDDLTVGGVELDFGPDSWVESAGAMEDYDGDGTLEALRDEIAGLVDREAHLRVRLDDEGDEGDVHAINDLTYRDVTGPAPWQPADAAGEDAIRSAAVAAVGDGARVVELEAEGTSAVAWEAEVVDANGREYDVLLDAAGNVIDVRED